MAAVNAAIGLEGTTDAAVIVHDKVRIFPVTAKFQARAVIRDERSIPWPVVHVQMNRFAIG